MEDKITEKNSTDFGIRVLFRELANLLTGKVYP